MEQPPIQTPPIQPPREVSTFAFTAGAFREFISGLPDRSVVVVFPYTSCNLTMNQVRGFLNGLGDADYMFDSSGWYVIRKLETTGGWLRITFDWRYWIYANAFGFGSQFRQLLGPELCTLLDNELGLAYATYTAGLTLERLLNIMPVLHLCADRVQRKLPENSLANRLLTDPIAILNSAIDVWRNDNGYINTRFAGGGFGLVGALQGLALANTLNSFIDSQNKKAANAHIKSIEMPLSYGFEHLRATQRFIQ